MIHGYVTRRTFAPPSDVEGYNVWMTDQKKLHSSRLLASQSHGYVFAYQRLRVSVHVDVRSQSLRSVPRIL